MKVKLLLFFFLFFAFFWGGVIYCYVNTDQWFATSEMKVKLFSCFSFFCLIFSDILLGLYASVVRISGMQRLE